MFIEFMGREVQVGYEPCGCKKAQAEARAEERAREESERALWLARVSRAGIPDRYAEVDAQAGPKYAAAADMYADALLKGRSVIAYGPVGTGKTWFACYLALKALRAGRSVRFTTTTAMLQSIRDSYDGGVNERALMHRYIDPDVLVLDDLGQERATEWALELLFNVINERYNARRPTVVTLQRRPSEAMAHFAECDKTKAYALMSRLIEGAKVVPFQGGDRRVKDDAGADVA